MRVPGVSTGTLASTVDLVIGAHDEQLAAFARLILFDRRGLGMSDPLVAGGAPPLEQQVHDVLAVMDAVGSGMRRVRLALLLYSPLCRPLLGGSPCRDFTQLCLARCRYTRELCRSFGAPWSYRR